MKDLLNKKTGIKVDAEGLSPMADISDHKFKDDPKDMLERLIDEGNSIYLQPQLINDADKEEIRKGPSLRRILRTLAAAVVSLLVLSASAAGALYAKGFRVGVIHEGNREPRYVLLSPVADMVSLCHLAGEDLVYTEEKDIRKEIFIVREGQYYVLADGVTSIITGPGNGMAVSEILRRAGIELGEDDLVSRAQDDELLPGERVKVRRVTYNEYTVTETIPYKARIKYSPLLRDGNMTDIYVYNPSDGKAVVTYRDKLIDGQVVEHRALERRVTREAVDYIRLVGAHVPASDIDPAKYTDVTIVDNVPTSYEKLYQGNCTAYSYKKGVWGAAGMYLYQGMVATDPKVIPYGSLLYITSPDGKFVYGWAIAADACDAAMEGRVLVDCFFETYRESCMFGKHYMNVYVVGMLNQEQLKEYRANGMFHRIPE